MRKLVHIVLLAAALLAASCVRRPLLELSDTHYVRIYLNEEIKNVTTGFYNEDNVRPVYEAPGIIRVTLANLQTGDVVAERFLRDRGCDEKGTYYEGYIAVPPGTYSLMAYNYDMETTRVKGENCHWEAKAYTNEIASHLKSRIPSRSKSPGSTKTNGYDKVVYDPDHLFRVCCQDVNIPYTDFIDTLRTQDGEYFRAESMVLSYYLQVRVKGLQFASSAVGLITGLSGSGWIQEGNMDMDDPVSVYFDMLPGQGSAAGVVKSEDGDEVIVYTTFNTFGKIPNMQNELEITFDFVTTYGEPFSESLDISQVFASEVAKEHQWLLIEHTIEIPEPPEVNNGGFDPGTEPWKDKDTDIII